MSRAQRPSTHRASGSRTLLLPQCASRGLLLMLLGGLSACARCDCNGDALATLEEMQGDVQTAGGDGKFEAASEGQRFLDGHALKTAPDGTAEVTLSDGTRVHIEASSLVVFRPGVGEQPATLELQLGNAFLTVGESDLSIQTRVGLATFEAGSQVRLSHEEAGTGFQVEIGSASLEVGDDAVLIDTELGDLRLEPGAKVKLAKGEGAGAEIELEFGEATLDGESVDKGKSFELEFGKVVFSVDVGDAEIEEAEEVPPPAMELAALEVVIEGRGSKQRAPGEKRFASLGAGRADVTPGTEFRLGKRATADLSFGKSKLELSRGASFQAGETPTEKIAELTRGRAVARVDAGGETQVAVEGGRIGIVGQGENGAQALLVAGPRSTTIRNRQGRVRVLGKRGQALLKLGEQAVLLHSGEIELGDRSPERADLIVLAGESATVRDPAPPTAVGFRVSRGCPKGGLVEVRRGAKVSSYSSAGKAVVNALLAPGAHRYTVKCFTSSGIESKAAARGLIRVMRDAGRARIPKAAPLSRIDTDGRRYTVLYQNLLPKVSFSWPRPPKASGYQLTLTPKTDGTPQKISTRAPRHTFEAGNLREGAYAVTFQTNDGKRRSKSTELRIDFDNAAPKASVTSPANGSAQPGQSVEVAGVAMEGWSVSVEGKPTPMGGKHRFSTTLTAPTATDSIAIRLAHPAHGVHYYLRHLRKP